MSSLTLTRTIDAPVARVFQAWSDPQFMRQWFFPGEMRCEATLDFRPGGAYELRMIAKDGEYVHHGHYREIVDQRHISFTWNSHVATDTLVSVTFESIGERTLLTLVHSHFQEPEQQRLHEQGWTGCLTNLDRFFQNAGRESGEEVKS